MASRDICADIAALLNPLPTSPGGDTGGSFREAGQVLEERELVAEALRDSWSFGDLDPLLSTLASLRQQRLRLEGEMRLLIAYGRCFTHPRPYKLIDLANAAEMSISGIRKAYGKHEVDQVEEHLGRPPSASKS